MTSTGRMKNSLISVSWNEIDILVNLLLTSLLDCNNMLIQPFQRHMYAVDAIV